MGEHKNLKQITKDELSQHIAMQKSIESEAIYLAATKANLEEQMEGLLNLLDQRDYELTMLNQSLTLQRSQRSTRTHHAMTLHGNENEESTLGDDINQNVEDNEDEYYNYNNDDDDEDGIDQIGDILDDVFEEFEDDDDNEENAENVNDKETNNEQIEDKNEKAFDKIKEYLHLSASAVKIKYPLVRNIQSDELIKRVKELPFYKYHDQMVRIMEIEIKKKRQSEKKDSQLIDGPPPIMQKRKSFLSIFNIFGGGDRNRGDSLVSDVDEDDDDKADTGTDDEKEN